MRTLDEAVISRSVYKDEVVGNRVATVNVSLYDVNKEKRYQIEKEMDKFADLVTQILNG